MCLLTYEAFIFDRKCDEYYSDMITGTISQIGYVCLNVFVLWY